MASSGAKISSVAGSVWTLEDPEGSLVSQFAVNDLIIIQNIDVNASSIVKRIVRRVSAVSSNTITVTAATGGPVDAGSPAKGDTVTRFGNSTNTSRQGVVLMTSDFANSPYIDVISGVTSWADWTGGTKTKVRIGLLTGITSTSNEYGFIAGNGFTSTDSWVKVSTSSVQQNNVTSSWKTSGVDFITIDSTNGIAITVNTGYVNQRAYTFTDGTETGGIYSYSQALGRGVIFKTVPTTKASLTEVLSESNTTYQAQTLVTAKSGSNTTTLNLIVTTSNARQATLTADTITFYPLGGTGTVIVDSNAFRVFTITPAETTTTGGSENVRIGVKNSLGTNYPIVVFENPSSSNSSIYGSSIGLTITVGANQPVLIGSSSLVVTGKITSSQTMHSGSGSNLTTGNISHFTGSYNSNASISMSSGVWGYSSVILFQAYHATQPTGGFLASGASKYFGSQYTGNVTAPGMIQWDANGNLWRWAIGEAGLATGDDITNWDIILTLGRTSFAYLSDTDNYAILGRAKIGYAGFSDNAAFAHFDHMTSTNFALIQGSGGKTVLNAASAQAIDFRIANVGIGTFSTTGLRIGDNTAAAYTIDAFEDSSGSFSDIIMSLERRISTTPANGMGGSIRFGVESSTTNNRDAGRIGMRWDTITDASRAASGFLSAYYITTENICVEWGSNATGPTLSFYNATKQNKQTVTGSRAGNAALASVLTALANLGLITNSSTA